MYYEFASYGNARKEVMKMFKLNLFKAKLAELGLSVKDIANAVGCNEVTMYRKMKGESDFTRNEIQLIKQKTQMTSEDVERIFFA